MLVDILLVEDNLDHLALLRKVFTKQSRFTPRIVEVHSLKESEMTMDSHSFDVVLLDLNLPDSRGLNTLSKVVEINDNIPIVVTTSLDDESLALSAVANGAQDFILKDNLSGEVFARSVLYAIERKGFENCLRAMNKDLRQFVSIMSHDLHAPVRHILARTNWLEQQIAESLGEEQKEAIDVIKKSCVYMQDLMDDLLKISMLAKKEPVHTEICVESIVNDVVLYFDSDIKSKQALIEIGKMPTIKADVNQLKLVFQNLIANALKFTKKASSPRIEISADPGEDHYTFRVKDNGIGIPNYAKNQIFRDFERLHHSSVYQGSGLGLSICKRIIESHQGSIWVESVEGRGSTFAFRLPVK